MPRWVCFCSRSSRGGLFLENLFLRGDRTHMCEKNIQPHKHPDAPLSCVPSTFSVFSQYGWCFYACPCRYFHRCWYFKQCVRCISGWDVQNTLLVRALIRKGHQRERCDPRGWWAIVEVVKYRWLGDEVACTEGCGGGGVGGVHSLHLEDYMFTGPTFALFQVGLVAPIEMGRARRLGSSPLHLLSSTTFIWGPSVLLWTAPMSGAPSLIFYLFLYLLIDEWLWTVDVQIHVHYRVMIDEWL